jgi:serine/threonine-protein kinase
MLGSPSYMSPEQVLGKAVDGRSDLFSLGVVLYEVLTGAEPFAGEHPSTILYNIVHGEHIPVRERNPALSPAFEAVLRRALAKDPGDRYPDARAFAGGLREAMEQAGGRPEAATQATVLMTPAPRAGRRRWAAAAAGCLLVLGVGGTWLWGRWSREAPRPPAPSAPATKPAAPPPEVQPGGAPAGGRAASGRPQDAGAAPQKSPAPSRGGGPVPAAGPARGAPASGLPPAPPTATRPAGPVGGIQVLTDPGVEVFLDGQPKGRAGKDPMLLKAVPAGEHMVTLRHGSFEQKFRHTVRENETLPLAYRFSP